jgi:uncharacterized protein
LFAALLLAGCGEAPLVEDKAEILSSAEWQRLGEYHELLRADFDLDYRVVTAPETGDIDRFAVEQYAALEVGAASRSHRGLLLVVDDGQDLVRLEVGHALEGMFPDAFIAYIEQRQMLPFFASGRIADGILATTELIVNRAQEHKLHAGDVDVAALAGSGGAGATADINSPAPVQAASSAAAPPGSAPQETLRAYIEAMADRNARSDLALYTPETRAWLAGWTMTPAQMDNLVRTYRRCGTATERRNGQYAVLRYEPSERACAPWFFRREGEVWLLDLTMMQGAIRFGRDNSWRFVPGASHPYEFAFEDWRFDANGFPIAQ